MLWLLRLIASFLILQAVLGGECRYEKCVCKFCDGKNDVWFRFGVKKNSINGEEEIPQCYEAFSYNSSEHTLGHVSSMNSQETSAEVHFNQCEFTIPVPQGHRMKLFNIHMQIEQSDFCSHGSLQINDTRNVRILCGQGNHFNPIFIEGVEYVHLSFRAEQQSKASFMLEYETSPNLEQCPGQKPCENGRCYDEEVKCNGFSHCGDGTDEEGCDLPSKTVECGEIEGFRDLDLLQPEETSVVTAGGGPWHVTLQIRHTFFSYVCGGSLISAQWVLTAARCFRVNPDPKFWEVSIGMPSKYVPYQNTRYVEKIVIGPNITSDDLNELRDYLDANDDIALIKLRAPVELSQMYHPVCLPQLGKDVEPENRFYTAVWEKHPGPYATMGIARVDVLSTSNCSYDPSTQICVKTPVCHMPCYSETGNSLITRLGSKLYVVGVASDKMDGKNREGQPTLATESTTFIKLSDKANWIRDMMDKYS